MDIQLGQTAQRTGTFTAENVQAYADITGDRNPLHFDAAFAASTRFRKLVVHGGLTTGLIHALVAEDLPGPGSVFLGQDWRGLHRRYDYRHG
ncbi:MAG: MaoC/PaaZ C-terminal domain-containing protein [Anaerolineales bacterium]